MRICNMAEKKMSLGERVFVFSEAGSREIAKEDMQSIPAENRVEAMEIYNELKQNDGIINLEKKFDFQTDSRASLMKESHRKAKIDAEEKSKPITLEDLKANFDKLSREERSSVLKSMDNLRAANQKSTKENGFKRLPPDIQATLGISSENLKKLTVDQRTILVKKVDDILQVETEANKKQILAEAIK